MRDKKGQTGGKRAERELEKNILYVSGSNKDRVRGKNRIRERPLINLAQLVLRKIEEGGKKLLSWLIMLNMKDTRRKRLNYIPTPSPTALPKAPVRDKKTAK